MTDTTDNDTTDVPDDEANSTTSAPERTETKVDDDSAANRDAAKYRRRLRDTEAERDSLAGRLESFQRREIERQAAQIVKQGAAVWLAGDPTEAFLDKDGDVDPNKVAETARRMHELFGVARAFKNPSREGTNPTPGPATFTPVDVVMGRNRSRG